MNILHLVLYSQDDFYESMYQSTQHYYNLFDVVKTYYYKYDEMLTNDYEIKGNVLLLKGKEVPYVPVNKTIQALNVFDLCSF